MRRDNDLLKRRKEFILDYLKKNEHKQMKVVIMELSEMLFISSRTIYKVIES